MKTHLSQLAPAWVVVAGTLAMLAATFIQSNQVRKLDAAIVQHKSVDIVTAQIVARTQDQDYAVWADLKRYTVPQVPAEAQTFLLDDIISCRDGYRAIAAWHEIIGSFPSIDVMYTVNANVTDNGDIQITMRARQGISGYAYIDVLVMCRSS